MTEDMYQFMIDFIDAMSIRGALKGHELFEVGRFRNQLLEEMERAKIETNSEESEIVKDE